MTRPVIFICYSHDDATDEAYEKVKKALLDHLSVLVRNDLAEIWSDKKIVVGSDWKPNIRRAIERTDIAILLMTPNFLRSDFIMVEEVPLLLERRPSLTVFPIIASSCFWNHDNHLKDLEVRPKDKEAVSERPDWKKVVHDLAQEVAAIVKSKGEAAETFKSEGGGRPEAAAKPPRKRFTWASATLLLKLVVLAVPALVLWMVTFSFTTRDHRPPLLFPPLSVVVDSPRFLSPNEEEELGFDIRNEQKPSDAQNENEGLHAKFSLMGEGSGTVPCIRGGLVFKGQVRNSQPEWGSSKFRCRWGISEGTDYLGEVAKLSLEGEVENKPPETQDLLLRVAPIPWVKKLRGYFGFLMLFFWSSVFVVWSFKTYHQKRMSA